MNLAEFRDAVASNPDCALRVEVDGGAAIAPHFHVTEVGRVTKDFVDCGGKAREETRCVLQTLVAGDTDHRLTSTKLSRILSLVDRLDLPADSPVEVEHQERSVSTDRVVSVTRDGDTLVVRLAPKATACLAEDACGMPIVLPTVASAEASTGDATGDAEADGSGCCSGPGCC